MSGFDKDTELWFRQHIGAETTVCRCETCGLYYKPELGHKCKGEKDEHFSAHGNA